MKRCPQCGQPIEEPIVIDPSDPDPDRTYLKIAGERIGYSPSEVQSALKAYDQRKRQRMTRK